MQISYKNFISGLLFVFLLNSAGVFSPSLAVRDSDFVSEIEISSNMVNRLIVLSSFMISIVFLFKNNKDFFKIIIIKAWPLWILVLYSIISCLWSEIPLTSFTRLLQQIFLITFILMVIRYLYFNDIFNVLKFFAIAIVIIGVLSIPFSFAWQDIGFRAIHGHKNTAGYIYALSLLIVMYDIFINKNKNKLNLYLLFTVFVLLIISKSKTSLALVISSSIFIYMLINYQWLKAKNVILSIFFTSGFVFLALLLVDTSILSDYGLDFTGRAIIWDFVIFEMNDYKWLGFGYRSFWGVGDAGLSVLYGGDFDFFITKLNQSHNTYLDIWIMLGYIGVPIFIAFVIHSIFEITRSNYLFIAILFFLIIHSFMETDFFRSNNLLWVLYVLIYLSSICHRKIINE